MHEDTTGFQKLVYKKIARIPKGKISTYKDVAVAIGNPNAYRAVGNALNKNPYAPDVPCHRVVSNTGGIGGFAKGQKEKIKILEKEGIKIKQGKVVDFQERLYRFK